MEISIDSTKELIVKAQNGDKEAREKLVTDNMGLIGSIVKRFLNRGYEREDLFQIGSIGLIKAIDKFDISYDVKFSTYAVPMIAGEIKRFLRDDGMIKVSRSLKENAMKIAKTMESFRKENLCEATVEQLSEITGIPVEEAVLSMEAVSDVDSIYKTVYQGDGSEVCLIDKIEEKRNYNEELINKIVVQDLLNELSKTDKKIIVMRYFEDKTQSQIAQQLGISQVQVSRMEKRILNMLRRKLA